MKKSRCAISDCDRRYKGHGYCEMHLERWKKNGDPLNKGGRKVKTAYARSLEKTSVRGEDDCWPYTGYLSPDGYGRINNNGRGSTIAHRVAYETMVGPIPEGHTIDHLCRTTSCMNTRHMQCVTNAENVRRKNLTAEEHMSLLSR